MGLGQEWDVMNSAVPSSNDVGIVTLHVMLFTTSIPRGGHRDKGSNSTGLEAEEEETALETGWVCVGWEGHRARDTQHIPPNST